MCSSDDGARDMLLIIRYAGFIRADCEVIGTLELLAHVPSLLHSILRTTSFSGSVGALPAEFSLVVFGTPDVR